MRSHKTIALIAAPLTIAGMAVAATPAQAANPTTILIQEMDALYKGPLSSAGKHPKMFLSADLVARAFVDMTTVQTARKVANKTDGKATHKGKRVRSQGFRCRAAKIVIRHPGTAGEYQVVTWKCHFQAADTPTEINLNYKQASL